MKIEERLIAEGTLNDMIKEMENINEENLDGLRMHKIGENRYKLYIKERREDDSYN